MTVSLRLSDEDSRLIKKYAELNSVSLSDLFRNAVIEKIEDEYDLSIFNDAMKEYESDPVTYSHEELKRLLDLDS